MRLTSQLLEAYLHCPTKCWLRSVGERITDSTHVSFTHAQNESFHTAAIQRLLSNAHQNEWIPSPSPVSLIAGEWRLAIRVLAQSHIWNLVFMPWNACRRRGVANLANLSLFDSLPV